MSAIIQDITIFAPAKVNLHLAVKDLRSDGFHNLESIFFSVDFGDTLRFSPVSNGSKNEILMEWDDDQAGSAVYNDIFRSIPAENNLIFRAMSLFREKTGYDRFFKVKVEKRIPPGGGLGGGSSDAAAALLSLNELSGGLLSRGDLLQTAASLGSDVPFFIYRTTAALVTGRGECIKPLEAGSLFPVPDTKFPLVLVNPGFPSPTAAAFRLLDEHRAGKTITGNRSPQTIDVSENTGSLCSSGPLFIQTPQSGISRNDFLPVFKDPEKSVYENIISRLLENGAVFAGLSGAGSTCFGFFSGMEQAQKAAQALRADWPFVKCCSSFP